MSGGILRRIFSEILFIVGFFTQVEASPCSSDCETKLSLCIEYHVCVGGRTVLQFKDRCQTKKHLLESCCPVDTIVTNPNAVATGCILSQAFDDQWTQEAAAKPGILPGGKTNRTQQQACVAFSATKLTKYQCPQAYCDQWQSDITADFAKKRKSYVCVRSLGGGTTGNITGGTSTNTGASPKRGTTNSNGVPTISASVNAGASTGGSPTNQDSDASSASRHVWARDSLLLSLLEHFANFSFTTPRNFHNSVAQVKVWLALGSVSVCIVCREFSQHHVDLNIVRHSVRHVNR